MEVATIAKNCIELQKRSFNNLYDATTLLLNCAKLTNNYWLYQMHIDKEAQVSVDQWQAVLKQNRNDSKMFINESFSKLENYLVSIGR